MTGTRRAYVYIAAAIALQALTWASISLLRNIALAGAVQADAAALQMAVILVAGPIYAGHWLAASRDARRSPRERGSTIRAAYLYGNLALFAVPWLASLFTFVVRAAAAIAGNPVLAAPTFTGGPDSAVRATDTGAVVAGAVPYLGPGLGFADPLAALVVLGVLMAVHTALLRGDNAAAEPDGGRVLLRRWFLLGGSAFGAGLTAAGATGLLRLVTAGTGPAVGGSLAWLGSSTRLAIGLGVWLCCWGSAQRVHRRGSDEERTSTLRAVYLLVVRAIAGVVTVLSSVSLLTGALRLALGMPTGGQLADTLPALIVGAVGWSYHQMVATEDREVRGGRLDESGRAYSYFMAAVGLVVVLAGAAASSQVVIRGMLATGFETALRSQFTWAAGAAIVGLPVWLLAWRPRQRAARAPGVDGSAERASPSRRAYLAFFLLAATAIVLSSATYVVYRVLAAIISEPATADDLALALEALAYAALGAILWSAHWRALASDRSMSDAERRARLETLRAVVIDTGDGRFGDALVEALRRDTVIDASSGGLTAEAASRLGRGPDDLLADLAGADLAVVSLPPAAGADLTALEPALASVPARVFVPRPTPGWTWSAAESPDDADAIRRAVTTMLGLVDAPTDGGGHRPSVAALGWAAALALGLLVVVPLVVRFVVGGGFLGMQAP